MPAQATTIPFSLRWLRGKKKEHTMIQITQFPIKKSIYYEITTALMAMNGGFHDTFSADHKRFVERSKTQASTL